MGGVARLARELGHEVSGSDHNVYPPMSTQLSDIGIELREGYEPAHLHPAPDLVVIGNALSRGNPAVESVLDTNIPFTSGPAWLHDNVLRDRHVLAVAGTHGKTSTSSALAWILEHAGLAPGFLIGGVPENFSCSAQLGDSQYFVVEADEYDSAFFDKRSKFVHYRPSTLVLNNLEFDHADIFDNMADIRRQFHHLMRIVPGNGKVIANGADDEIRKVLAMGCWTPVEQFFAGQANTVHDTEHDWLATPLTPDCTAFAVQFAGNTSQPVSWPLIGQHNMANGLAAIAAAHAAGVSMEKACTALETFQPAKRRLEFLGKFSGVNIYEDFAHHPTAIRATLEALQAAKRNNDSGRIIAVLEPRSNTMKMGVHCDALRSSLKHADLVYFYQPGNLQWDAATLTDNGSNTIQVLDDTSTIIDNIATQTQNDDVVVIMTNGDFEALPRRLLERLSGGDAKAVD